MGKITRRTKRKHYFKIFEQIFENPIISITGISENIRLTRNTVAKYLAEMYEKNVLIGPQITMKSAPNYREYVYLMNFSDPFTVFERLKRFPHVLYHAMTFGDWNTMVVANKLLDFSQLVSFQNMVNQSSKGGSYTPKPEYTTWSESLKRAYSFLEGTFVQTESRDRRAPLLDWGEDEWKLFCAFKSNMRKKVAPVLRKIKVRYDIYRKWVENLEAHCTINTEFYPEGYHNYTTYCFLLHTENEILVKSLVASFPTTTCSMVLNSQLLVFVSVNTPQMAKGLFCLIYDMKTKKIIRGFNQSVALLHYQHE